MSGASNILAALRTARLLMNGAPAKGRLDVLRVKEQTSQISAAERDELRNRGSPEASDAVILCLEALDAGAPLRQAFDQMRADEDTGLQALLFHVDIELSQDTQDSGWSPRGADAIE